LKVAISFSISELVESHPTLEFLSSMRVGISRSASEILPFLLGIVALPSKWNWETYHKVRFREVLGGYGNYNIAHKKGEQKEKVLPCSLRPRLGCPSQQPPDRPHREPAKKDDEANGHERH